MKIQNLNVSNNFIKIPKDSIYHSCQQYLPSKEDDLIRERISFELIDTNTATANAIRRVLTSEIDILCLTFDIGGSNTNSENYDPYILEDYVCSRLNMIPLSYDIDKTDEILNNNCKYEINITNNTTELLYITSNNIKIQDNKKSLVKFFNQINIIPILTGYKLNIKNIYIKKDNSGKITPVTNFTFKAINKIEDKTDFTKLSSNFTTYTNYYFQFDTMGVDSIKLLNHVFKILINRLKNIKEKTTTDINSERYIFKIANETYTIANIIVSKIYELDKNIPFVTFEQPHPLKNEIWIIVKHINPEQIFNKSIESCIDNFSILLKNNF